MGSASSLRSLQRQTLADWECLVVDDGSQDATALRVERLAASDPRIRLLRTPAQGVVAARNTAAAQARADAVAILDADDLAHRERLRLQLAQLEAQGGGVVSCLPRYFRRSEVGPGLARYEAWLRRQTEGAALLRARFIEMPYAHSSLMLERRLGAGLGWYRDHPWPEDFDLSLRLAASGAPHGVIPRALLAWRVRADSLLRTDARYSISAFAQCRAEALARDLLQPEQPWMLWGHGETGKALRQALAQRDRRPAAILEVDPRKIGQRIEGIPVRDALAWIERQVLGSEAVPADSRLLISVAGATARRKIRAALAPTAWVEGESYFFAA